MATILLNDIKERQKLEEEERLRLEEVKEEKRKKKEAEENWFYQGMMASRIEFNKQVENMTEQMEHYYADIGM